MPVLRLLSSVRHAQRSRPLITIAHEPHMPTRQAYRNAMVGSSRRWASTRASSTVMPSRAGTQKRCSRSRKPGDQRKTFSTIARSRPPRRAPPRGPARRPAARGASAPAGRSRARSRGRRAGRAGARARAGSPAPDARRGSAGAARSRPPAPPRPRAGRATPTCRPASRASPRWWPTAAAGSAADASASVAHVDGEGQPRRLRLDARVAHRLGPYLGAGALRVAGHDRDRLRRGLREIAPVVRAPALGALERAPGDEPGGGDLALEVEPVLPRHVEGAGAPQRDRVEPVAHLLDDRERALEPLAGADQSHVLPHHLAQAGLQGVEALALV